MDNSLLSTPNNTHTHLHQITVLRIQWNSLSILNHYIKIRLLFLLSVTQKIMEIIDKSFVFLRLPTQLLKTLAKHIYSNNSTNDKTDSIDANIQHYYQQMYSNFEKNSTR